MGSVQDNKRRLTCPSHLWTVLVSCPQLMTCLHFWTNNPTAACFLVEWVAVGMRHVLHRLGLPKLTGRKLAPLLSGCQFYNRRTDFSILHGPLAPSQCTWCQEQVLSVVHCAWGHFNEAWGDNKRRLTSLSRLWTTVTDCLFLVSSACDMPAFLNR